MALNTWVAGNPGSARAMADSMNRHGTGVEEVASGWYRVKGRAEGDWEGRASEAFQGVAVQQGGDGDALARLFPLFGQACTVWADEIDTVKARMDQAKQIATEGQLMVFGDSIYPPKPFTGVPPGTIDSRIPGAEDEAPQQSAQYEAAKALHAKQEAAFAEAQATVVQARGMEKVAHEKLSRSMDVVTGAFKDIGQSAEWGDAAASPTSPTAAALAGAAMDMETHAANATRAGFEAALQQGPAAVKGCWASLTTAQRADLMTRFPEMVGSADGLPTPVRHEANMSRLGQQRQALLTKLHDAQERLRRTYSNPNGPNQLYEQEVEELRQAIDGIDRLKAVAEQPGKYLLALDSTANSRGQVIIASGNPDTAQNVVTTVPGTYSDLGDTVDYVARGDAVVDRAKQFSDESFASVTWIDYESPKSLLNASEGRFADDASSDLSRFQEGIRASHEGSAQSNNTVIGHSYGSTTVGYAGRDHGLHSDNVVFIGSPGVGVDHASELGVPAGHVWSGTSGLDVIDYVTPSPNPLDHNDITDDQHWFGRDPSNGQFGARELPTETWSGHSGYWDNQESLDGMAKVVAGKTNPQDGTR